MTSSTQRYKANRLRFIVAIDASSLIVSRQSGRCLNHVTVRPLPEPRGSTPYPDILILISHRFLGLLSHMFSRTGFPTKYRSASLSYPCCVPRSVHFIAIFLNPVIEGKIEVMGRRERRRKQLLDDFKVLRGYCKLKEGTLDRIIWRTRFGRGYIPA